MSDLALLLIGGERAVTLCHTADRISVATNTLPARNPASMLRLDGADLGAAAAGEETQVTTEDTDSPTGSGSLEFAQIVREFTDLIRRIQANDLSAGDRARLRSLLDTLTELWPSEPA